MESALKCLNRLDSSPDKRLCLGHLPRFYQVAMVTLISHHKSVQAMATNCMASVLEQCVQTNISLLVADPEMATLHKVFGSIEAGLGYQYHMSWAYVMRIVACAFTSFKSVKTFPCVQKCLASLGKLRESDQFTYKKEADLAIGRAIQTYGPRLILHSSIPLNITGDE